MSITPYTPKRVLITGLSTYWGGRLAQALEVNNAIDAIIGVDTEDPTCELDRTEFIRVGTQHSLIRRIVEAAQIDTVIDSRLAVDSVMTTPRLAHENNVIGTMNILAACGGGSPVKKFVFKSSAHIYGSNEGDPAFFTEDMARSRPAGTPVERDIVEAEGAVVEFAKRNPDVAVAILRCTNVLGSGVVTSTKRLLSLPAIPSMFGFDTRLQFVHEDDVVASLEYAAFNRIAGVYNVGADGVLVLSEVADILDKPLLPVLPPRGTTTALALLRRAGLRIPLEMVDMMRYGRAVDNRKLKAAGFRYRYTTRQTIELLSEYLRLKPVLEDRGGNYQYDREVEEFLRWSPSVVRKDS